MSKKINNILKFLKDIELLKSTLRHSWVSAGRRESVAEHSWRVAVLALILQDEFKKINIQKVIEMLLIHDFGEVYDGDTPAFLKKNKQAHYNQEKLAVQKLVKPLGVKIQKKIIALWVEYEDGQTLEARLAKALDKIEVLIQHNEADLKTWTAQEYQFNLKYGQEFMNFHQFILEFRKIIDLHTKKKISQSK